MESENASNNGKYLPASLVCGDSLPDNKSWIEKEKKCRTRLGQCSTNY
jgi:hypothetical protein